MEKMPDGKMFKLGHTSGIISECFPINVLTKLSDSSA